MPLPKYIVRLTANERAELNDLIRTGKRAASVLTHARILLKADAGADGPSWDDAPIAEAVECGASTVYRVHQAFVEEGLPAGPLPEEAHRSPVSQARRGPGGPPDRAGVRGAPRGTDPLDLAAAGRPLG